jgi:hypothetical protein
MKLLKIRVRSLGMAAVHNMPCAVCWLNPAVLHTNYRIFEPCWPCQAKGWQTRKLSRFVRWLLRFW